MANTIFMPTYETTFVAYSVFASLVAVRGARNLLGASLFAAATATAVWAQARVAVEFGFAPDWLGSLLDGLRDAGWLGLCLAIIHRRGGYTSVLRALIAICGMLVALQVGFDASQYRVGIAGLPIDGALMRVAVTVFGLVLVENISRNSSSAEFWALKHLLIGLVCILAFQLLSRVPEFLTSRQDPSMTIAGPLVFLLALPLFVVSAIRFPNLQVRLHSSRAFVFHSATLVAAGIMLQGVAVAAWYVREYGGSNGAALAVMLLFGGAVSVAVTLASGSIRSRVRKFINENFFSLKYDYRVEWEKVIRALSLNPEQGSAERVLRTLCDLFDCPGGALWIYRSSWHQFLPAAKLGFSAAFAPIGESDHRIDLLRSSDNSYLNLAQKPAAAPWLEEFSACWIVVALRYRSELVGVAVLSKPRAPKTLDWEDENLIRLVALQLGAYLVQEETAQSLADARQLEDFNKRFAFIVHDIKNTIGQLSLLVRNAAQFGHKQEFRDDMVVTLANAVDRLQMLLKGLTAIGTETVPHTQTKETIDLIGFLQEFTKERVSLGQLVRFATKCQSLVLELKNINNLQRVLEHVVSNAVDASGADQFVEISVSPGARSIEIIVEDHGPGMTEKFIKEELFRPMRTTKAGGFGIGAYQARELMHELGGDIMVASIIGQGTSVALSLPCLEPREAGAE